MTFEEAYKRITSGERPGSPEQVEAELDVLAKLCRNTPVLIAIDIADARSYRPKDKTFWAYAQNKWDFAGDKTIYHYYAVGALLTGLRDFQGTGTVEKENRALEARARKTFDLCLTLAFGKLAKLTVLMNDKQRGLVEVMNFMKNQYDPQWTSAQFRAKVDELYGYGQQPEKSQMTFTFDLFGDLEESRIDHVFSRDVGAACAMQIVNNNALICRYAARQLAEHADDFGEAALTEFERLSAELEEAKRHLDGVITGMRRSVMGLN